MSLLFPFFFVLTLYAALISFLHYGWSKIIQSPSIEGKKPVQSQISLIIAFRNEANNLQSLLQDIERQSYSKTQFELIMVDDDSEDDGSEIIKKFMNGKSFPYRLLQSKGGKKKAIQKGVEAAQFPWLHFTDADCRFGKNYVKNWAAFAESNSCKLASAAVFYPSQGFGRKMMALEFASLVASGAGAIAIDQALMANGANLLVEKQAWNDINANRKDYDYASGDDIFLLHHMMQYYDKGQVLFNPDPELAVQTAAPDSFKAFIQQRFRWTSKSKHYKNIFSLSVAFLVFFTALAQLFLLFYSEFWYASIPVYFLLFTLIKLIIDLSFLHSFLKHYQRKQLLPYALLWAWIYPFYIVFTALFGNVLGFKWKGRRY